MTLADVPIVYPIVALVVSSAYSFMLHRRLAQYRSNIQLMRHLVFNLPEGVVLDSEAIRDILFYAAYSSPGNMQDDVNFVVLHYNARVILTKHLKKKVPTTHDSDSCC